MADEESQYIGGPQVRSVAWRGCPLRWPMAPGRSRASPCSRLWKSRPVAGSAASAPGSRTAGRGPRLAGASRRRPTARATPPRRRRASIDWAFDALGWTDVIHCIHPDNVASQRVAERLGATNRGPGRMPAPYDDLPINIWGQTRDGMARTASLGSAVEAEDRLDDAILGVGTSRSACIGRLRTRSALASLTGRPPTAADSPRRQSWAMHGHGVVGRRRDVAGGFQMRGEAVAVGDARSCTGPRSRRPPAMTLGVRTDEAGTRPAV